MPAISTQLHPHENLQRPSHTRTSSSHARVSPKGQSPSTIVYTFAQPSATSSVSPSSRYPLTRPLSPDLPVRDALYLFSNFSSYMRSPHEGAEGIVSSADFRDTIRLLDFARHYAATPHHNVHILHLKYRFQSQSQIFRSPYASGDYRLPMNYRDSTGRLRNPVPQPFSTLNDPVIKVDYKENGVFEPLPAEAIFRHIATVCQPPPRIIVFSHVCSHVTQNHLAALSSWALASSPPAYIFSPLETRIREQQSLPIALHHAIPMSMYASPPSNTPIASPTNNMAQRMITGSSGNSNRNNRGRRLSVPNISSSSNSPPELSRFNSQQEKFYPPAPVASLTVTPDSATCPNSADDATVPPPPGERIPLWALAPGVGILHGSTSASIGVKLGDFSAINLTEPTDGSRPKSTSMPSSFHAPRGLINPSMNVQTVKSHHSLSTSAKNPAKAFIPPVEAPLRPITPSKALGTSAIPVKMMKSNNDVQTGPIIHLTPPDQAPSNLVSVSPGSWEGERSMSNGTHSWPNPVNKPSGWRRGGKEKMEDILDGFADTKSANDSVMKQVVARIRALELDAEETNAPPTVAEYRTSTLLALL